MTDAFIFVFLVIIALELYLVIKYLHMGVGQLKALNRKRFVRLSPIKKPETKNKSTTKAKKNTTDTQFLKI